MGEAIRPGPSDSSGGAGGVTGASVGVLPKEDGFVVASNKLVFSGDYSRSGLDLQIHHPDGETATLHDYFRGRERASLHTTDGASLSGATVEALAGARVQLAQQGGTLAQNQIGRVEQVSGTATAVRNGVPITLNVGDPVYRGDVVQTGAGSSLAISFIDGTAFNLAANARMVLNEMVYDPAGSANSTLLTLVQGSISFVAGQVAKTGDMRVDTPVATMGIRGTAVHVEISAENGPTRFSVLTEPNGLVGSYVLYSRTDGSVLATVSRPDFVTLLTPAGNAISVSQVQKTPTELATDQGIVQQVFQTFTQGRTFQLQGPAQQGPGGPGDAQPGGEQNSTSPPAGANPPTASNSPVGGSGTSPSIITTSTLDTIAATSQTILQAAATSDFASTQQQSFLGDGRGTGVAQLPPPPAPPQDPVAETPVAPAVTQPTPVTTTISGRLLDGYIVNGRVFVDANRNGVQDAGEAFADTDGIGQFTLQSGAAGPLVAGGGTDVATGLVLRGMMAAPPGYAVITPFSTLVAALTGDLAGTAGTSALSLEAAEAKLATIFNVSTAALRSDVYETALGGNVGSWRLAVKILDAVALAAAATASPDNPDAYRAAFAAAAARMADAIKAMPDVVNGGQQDLAALVGYLAASAVAPGHQDLAEAVGRIASSLASLGDEGASATMAGTNALARLAQGTIADAVAAASADPTKLAALVADYSGDGLRAALGLTIPNHAPILSLGPADAVASVGDGLLFSGLLTFTDADAADAHTAGGFLNGPILGSVSALVVQDSFGGATGLIRWEELVSRATLDALAQGDRVVDSFTVTVSDGRGGTASQVVTVTFEGVNDAPVVVSGTASGRVVDTGFDAAGVAQAVASATGVIVATDVDRGATLSWSVDGGGRGSYGSLAVDGAGRWTYQLDQGGAADALALGEVRTETFAVRVFDEHQAAAVQTVTITVVGSNDLPRVAGPVSSSLVQGSGAASVDLLGGVSDPDAGSILRVANLVWREGAGLPAGFAFDAVTGRLTVDTGSPAYAGLSNSGPFTVHFDYDVVDEHGAHVAQSATVTLDHVDVAPVFTIPTTPLVVAEDGTLALDGTSAFSVVDPDSILAITLRVSHGTLEVVDDGGATVSGDGTGLLVVTGTAAEASAVLSSLVYRPDPDVNGADAIIVSASDGARSYGPYTVPIQITPVNDAPTDVTLDNLSVDENAPGAVVGTLSVADPDAGDHFTYTLSDNRFEVLGTTLKLRDGIALDHETEANVAILVTARDQDGLETESLFTVAVADRDDPPTGVSFANGLASVDENGGPRKVADILVEDDAPATYGFTVSDPYHFEVRTGGSGAELWFLGNADYEEQSSYTVSVSATQGAFPPVAADYTLVIADVDEAPTVVGLDVTSVPEDATGALANVIATDPEGDPLTLTVDDPRFEIVEGTLVLRDGEILDHESEPSIRLTITATDPGGHSAQSVLFLDVTDVDDAPTALDLVNAVASTPENGGLVKVADLVVTDATPGTYTYGVSDPYNFEVRVDDTGAATLWFLGGADAEANGAYAVTVTAQEGNSTPVFADYVLAIDDVDESPIVFGLDVTSVLEDASGDIANLIASDPEGGALAFTVDDPRFEIVGSVLRLAYPGTLDHESEPTISLLITATDPGGLVGQTTVVLNVADANEAPVVSDGSTLSGTVVDAGFDTMGGAVGEDTATGFIEAIDPDAGAVLTYTPDRSRGTYGTFSVDAAGHWTYVLDATGAADALPVEAQRAETFTVRVADEFGAYADAGVTITVVGSNDRPVAVADSAITNRSAAVPIPVLANDTDVDTGDTLSILYASIQGGAGGSVSITQDGTGLIFDPAGAYTYLAPGAFADVLVTYRLSDNHGGQADGAATVRVVAGSSGPASNGDDQLVGTSGADLLTGLGGSDLLVGLQGADTLDGGPDGTSGDRVDYQHDLMWGGTLGIISNLSTSAITVGGITVQGGHIRDGFGDIDTVLNVESVQGTATADYFQAGANGGTITPRGGADTIVGGAGFDELRYDRGSPPAGIVVDVAAGTVLDPWGDTDVFSSVEIFGGTGSADVFRGGATTSTFRGLGGADTFTGGSSGLDRADYSTDQTRGGAGAIRVNLSSAAATFDGGTYAAGTARDGFGGTDTLQSIRYVRGTDLADWMLGGDADESFVGAGGNDTFQGGAGADSFEGGAGNDLFQGGAGRDNAFFAIQASTPATATLGVTEIDATSRFITLTDNGTTTSIMRVTDLGGGSARIEDLRAGAPLGNDVTVDVEGLNFFVSGVASLGASQFVLLHPTAPTLTGTTAGSVTEDVATGAFGNLAVSDPDLGATHTYNVTGGVASRHTSFSYAVEKLHVVNTANGTVLYNNDFDGTAVTAAASFTGLSSTLPSSSSGTAVLLDSANGTSSRGIASADNFLFEDTLLFSSRDNSTTTGLKKGGAWAVEATFDLARPDELREAYGLRLTDLFIANDGTRTGGDDVVDLVVRKSADGTVRVQLITYDSASTPQTSTTIASSTLNASASETKITLRLSHVANDGTVTASYDLSDGTTTRTVDIVLSGGAAAHASLFGTDTAANTADDELWTRAQLVAYAPTESDSYVTDSYGTFSIGQSGNWQYQLLNGSNAVQNLAGGQTVTPSYGVTVTDAHRPTSDALPITITVNGTNDAPTLSGDYAFAVGRGDHVVLTTADISASDRDTGAANLVFTVAAASHGQIRVDDALASSFTQAQLAAGRVAFYHDGDAAAGASLSVTLTDGGGNTTPISRTLTGTVTDTGPTALGFTNADTSTPENGGAIKVADIVVTDATPTSYAYTLSGNDSASFEVRLGSGGAPELWFLGGADYEAQTSFVVTVSAREGTSSPVSADFSLAIEDVQDNGSTNISGDSNGQAVEDETFGANGQLYVNGALAGQDHFQEVAPEALQGAYGTFAFDAATGEWAYQLSNYSDAVQALTDDETVHDTLIVTSADGNASQTIDIEINGRTGTFHAYAYPIAAAPTRGTVVDQGTGEAYGFVPYVSNFYDALFGPYSEGGTGYYPAFGESPSLPAALAALLPTTNGQGEPGSAWLFLNYSTNLIDATGAVSYRQVDATADGYILSYGIPTSAIQVGTSDYAESVLSHVDGQVVDGVLTSFDFAAGSVSLQGVYGQLTLSEDGSYSYILDPSDPDVQALAHGEVATDRFTIMMKWQNQFATADVDIEVRGPNTLPRLLLPLGQNVVGNGSFEIGPPVDPSTHRYDFTDGEVIGNSTMGGAWEAATGTPGIFASVIEGTVDGLSSADASRVLALGNAGGIRQSVWTDTGATYSISFDVAGALAGGAVPSTHRLLVTVLDGSGNTLAEREFNPDGSSPAWQRESLSFIAADDHAVVIFRSLDDPSDAIPGNAGPLLDDIQISAARQGYRQEVTLHEGGETLATGSFLLRDPDQDAIDAVQPNGFGYSYYDDSGRYLDLTPQQIQAITRFAISSTDAPNGDVAVGWTYSLTPDALDFLNANETLNLYFDSHALDGVGSLVVPVHVTLQGTSDEPTPTDAFLQGDWLEIGVSGSGSLGTAHGTPSGFHTGYRGNLSVIAKTDDGVWTPDMSLAQRQDAIVLGYADVNGGEIFVNAERDGRRDIATTTGLSANGDAVTTGTALDANGVPRLHFVQTVHLDPTATYFVTTITVTNLSAETADDVRFMRSFNPDQGIDYGSYYASLATFNDVLANAGGATGSASAVQARAGSGATVTLVALGDDARASSYQGEGTYNLSPYVSQSFDEPSDPNGQRADKGISLTFKLGDIASGQSVTQSFVTAFSTVTEGDTWGTAGDDYLVASGGTVATGAGHDIVVLPFAARSTVRIEDFSASDDAFDMSYLANLVGSSGDIEDHVRIVKDTSSSPNGTFQVVARASQTDSWHVQTTFTTDDHADLTGPITILVDLQHTTYDLHWHVA